jgi:hypothetical protein
LGRVELEQVWLMVVMDPILFFLPLLRLVVAVVPRAEVLVFPVIMAGPVAETVTKKLQRQDLARQIKVMPEVLGLVRVGSLVLLGVVALVGLGQMERQALVGMVVLA